MRKTLIIMQLGWLMMLWRIITTTITVEVMLEQERNRKHAIVKKQNVLNCIVTVLQQESYVTEIVTVLDATTLHPVKRELLLFALLWIDNQRHLGLKSKVMLTKKDVIVPDQDVSKNTVNAILLEWIVENIANASNVRTLATLRKEWKLKIPSLH